MRQWGIGDGQGADQARPDRVFSSSHRRGARAAMVLVALVWTQFPLGNGARAEGGRAIDLCCAWGKTLADGDLTWSVAADGPTAEVIRAAVREWDDALVVTLTELPGGSEVDIAVAFTPADGRTEGQAVTSFTQRGLIKKVDVSVSGPPAPANSGGLLQIAKHELGHALGLGHANHEGNLMSEAVSPEPAAIPACAVDGVVQANRWRMVDPHQKRPQPPTAAEVGC